MRSLGPIGSPQRSGNGAPAAGPVAGGNPGAWHGPCVSFVDERLLSIFATTMDSYRPELAEFWPDGHDPKSSAPQAPPAKPAAQEADADEQALAALFETVNAARAVY